jgi:predicted transcriptional regulator
VKEKEFFELVSSDSRREILRSIADEPKYLFQLAQELNRSQQAIQRHLQCLLEKGWIVQDQVVEGSKGPARKLYRIAKNVSVRIMLSQHSFNFEFYEIEEEKYNFNLDSLKAEVEQILVLLSESGGNIDYAEQVEIIRNLDQVLTHIGEFETVMLSHRLTLSGEINETIFATLDGDAHRKDREVVRYTIYDKNKDIDIELFRKNVKGPPTELLASLKRLKERKLLTRRGQEIITELESSIQANSK